MYIRHKFRKLHLSRICLNLCQIRTYVPIFKKRKLYLFVVMFISVIIILHKYVTHLIKDQNRQIYENEEEKFPIAYSIMVYQNTDHIIRLFNAIYHPSNYYCFHVDAKSLKSVKKLVKELWETYDNVILPMKFIPVFHARFNVLEAEILCMEALLKTNKRLKKPEKDNKYIYWKYFINLTGQEWPLKTNLEIVRILKALNGSNSIEKLKFPKSRLSSHRVPLKIKLWKGAVHIIAKWQFVEFALENWRAQDLLKYLKKETQVPDETFFATLNNDHSFKAPGGYSGNLTRHPTKLPFISRHKIWSGEGKCYGYFQQKICVFGIGDIPDMIDPANPHLFANKFVKGQNDKVLNYMEEWFYKRVKTVYQDPSNNPFINLEFYRNLAVTKEHF